MNDYYEVTFTLDPASETVADLLAAALGDAGFESFVSAPDGQSMTAYIKAELFDADAIDAACADTIVPCTITWKKDFVEGRDWNAEWERNYFQPIVIGDRCVVHSSFHTDIPHAEYDIVIDPKMAFGTGHHATTSLMAESILDLDLNGMSVIDMGTGTGILAMLAAMRGARNVVAIEIDPFAYENAIENIASNNCSDAVTVINGDASALTGITTPADIFLANINRNIITADLPAYTTALADGGIMLLSGFYEADVEVILPVARKLGLEYVSHRVRDNWTCLKLRKQ